MNLEVLLPVLTIAAVIVGAILAALRNPREEAAAVVELQSKGIADLQRLNDELENTLDRCRSEREWCRQRRLELERELGECRRELDGSQRKLDECCGRFKQVEANLRACVHREESLEQRLIELGEEPDGRRPADP